MIPVKEIYDSVAKDNANSAENGDLDYATFNRMSEVAELRILDYISGDIENLKPPAPYTSQKIKDYLSTFITLYAKPVVNGKVSKPEDYYLFENIEMVGNFNRPSTCDEDIEGEESCNTPIELVDSAEYSQRCRSYITGLRPSFTKPIANIVGEEFEFRPKDIGNIQLKYIRYPKFAKIVSKMDEEFHQLIIDEVASTDYEYGKWAKELLIYFISMQFSTQTREDSLMQHKKVEGKLVRDEK